MTLTQAIRVATDADGRREPRIAGTNACVASVISAPAALMLAALFGPVQRTFITLSVVPTAARVRPMTTEIAEIITRDTTEGAKARVRRIPAVFINGRQARNTTLADLQAIIDKELEKAGKK